MGGICMDCLVMCDVNKCEFFNPSKRVIYRKTAARGAPFRGSGRTVNKYKLL